MDGYVTALISAGSALVGVTVKGVWDWLRSRNHSSAAVERAKIVDAGQIRAELWAEINALRERMDQMQDELDKTRRGYLELLAEHTALKTAYRTLKHEHDVLIEKHSAVERELADLKR